MIDRANRAVNETRLTIDYYRIRRKLAAPLPIEKLAVHAYPMAFDSAAYPWSVWLCWSLEERVHCLGWGFELLENSSMRVLLERDLLSWTNWPRFDQYESPDLSLAHSLRTFVAASRSWPWLSHRMQLALNKACQRGVDAHVDWYDADCPGTREGQPVSHNIPVIGTLALATAARFCNHHESGMLHEQALAMVRHLLKLRETGYSEAVAYDGYILWFLANWLAGESQAVCDEVFEHPQWQSWLDQSVLTAAPGRAEAVAPLGDVEPYQMPFHIGATAALQRMQATGTGRWLLENCHPSALRSEALGLLLDQPEVSLTQPPCGASDAHCAVVLRSGYASDDLAVVAGVGRSPKDHVHLDAGSMLLGHRGHWFIDDPGYQQYLETSERAFTINAQAHNTPLIDGQGQTQHAACRLLGLADDAQPGVSYAALETTGAYAVSGLNKAVRHLWLLENRAVIVADELAVNRPVSLSWNWHGNADAAWWVEPRGVILYLNATTCHIQCPTIELRETMINRRRGSRGQLTLTALHDVPPGTHVTWWVFSFGDMGQAQLTADGCACSGRGFVPGRVHPQ